MNKKVKKAILPTMLILGIIFVGLFSVSSASALGYGKYPGIVSKIAQKFNLNEADVQAVFDDEREDRYANMYAKWSEKLDDLVNEGKIIKEQKESLLNKHEEIHNKMLELQDMEPAQRREETKKLHEEVKLWAEEQGIKLPFFGHSRDGFGIGFRAGHMTGGGY